MIAVAAVVLAIALLVVGGVALWGALTSKPAAPGPGTSTADPSAASGAVPSTNGNPKPTDSASSAKDALIVRCHAPRCGVFISSVPDGDILFNGTLRQGDERHADEPRMALVVSDASAVDVYINGRLAPKGPPGKRKTYTIVKSS